MAQTKKQTIAVFGATGLQGGGVVRALQEQDRFTIRSITRSASKARGLPGEVKEADLTRPETLGPALEGAYGVFAVTNSWEGPGTDERAQGQAAVDAAAKAGVQHFIWSTLPDVRAVSGGTMHVDHFDVKADVDALVRAAGFASFTFVEPPFYFQNLTGVMGPQLQPDGSKVWMLPMNPEARVIHMGDILELGSLVAGAFAQPEKVGKGQHLALCGDLMSWNDVMGILKSQGHRARYQRIAPEAYDATFPGAREMRRMMEYFEAHTYFGPEADQKISLARKVTTKPATDFGTWARANMKPS